MVLFSTIVHRKDDMNKKEALKIYNEQIEKIRAYSLMMATVSFDRSTVAPSKGNDYRNRMMSIISGEAFAIETDPKFIEAVLYLSKLDLGETANRDIALAKKELEDTIKFTKEESMAYALASMEGYDSWYKAKTTDDYSVFEPKLMNLIELTKQRAHKRKPEMKAYNVMLDDFEEGMNTERYDEFFALIKKELLPLIKKIDKKKDCIDDSFLYKYYPAEKQAVFMKEVLKYLGFDRSWGYMGETEHPFTNGFSRNDVRITTNYDEHNVAGAVFSTVHESGHAFYEHQVDPKYDRYLFLHSMSSGMHESQSRFFENYLGRRESFWKTLYPKLQKIFPENLGDVSLEQFIRAINVSKCSLIRTDADELTYPIHILIRYELEKEIFSGKADLSRLNVLWKEKYKKYLGIDVPNERDGILQDVHWSEGMFGYFPTYALGSAIGAQLLHTMEKDLDIDDLLGKGKFKVITDYLKKNVQKYGSLYDFDQILKMATGESFDPKYYIDYLKDKYTKLYDIKG